MKAPKDSKEANKTEDHTEAKVEPSKDEHKPINKTCYAYKKHSHKARDCKEVRPFNGYCYS